jgi:hypothetical protein
MYRRLVSRLRVHPSTRSKRRGGERRDRDHERADQAKASGVLRPEDHHCTGGSDEYSQCALPENRKGKQRFGCPRGVDGSATHVAMPGCARRPRPLPSAPMRTVSTTREVDCGKDGTAHGGRSGATGRLRSCRAVASFGSTAKGSTGDATRHTASCHGHTSRCTIALQRGAGSAASGSRRSAQPSAADRPRTPDGHNPLKSCRPQALPESVPAIKHSRRCRLAGRRS